MKLLIILSSLIAIQARTVKRQSECNIITINGTNYEIESLYKDLDRPFLLAVDHSTNVLYFSYSVKVDEDEFRSARLNLNTKEFKNIEGVNNGFAQTIDQKSHNIYIGGSTGLYKYNYGEDKAEFIGANNVNIWTIFFKDVLYYSTYPSQFLYTFIDGESTRFVDLEDTKVDNFVIDNEDIIFFTNNTGLYSQKKGTKDAKLYKEFTVVGVRGLTVDLNGNVYACLQDGIYAVKKSDNSLERVLYVDDAFGVAFDNDNNIVYSDATSVFRLKPTMKTDC